MRRTQLSENAAFTIENGTDHANKKIKFFYDDPDKQFTNLMVVLFPLGKPPIDPIEIAMQYDEQKKQWSAEVERPNNAREEFHINPNVTPHS